MSKKAIYSALILIIATLAGCSNSESAEDSPRQEDKKTFVVANAQILAVEDCGILDAYTLGLTSSDGDYLSFKILNSSLTIPHGSFETRDKESPGAISELKYKRKDNSRDEAVSLSIFIYDFKITGTLTTRGGRQIELSGDLNLEFKLPHRKFIFNTLTDISTDYQSYSLEFSNGTPYGYFLSVNLELTEEADEYGSKVLKFTPKYLELKAFANDWSAGMILIADNLQTTLSGHILMGKYTDERFDITFTCEIPIPDHQEPNLIELNNLLSVDNSTDNFVIIKIAEESVTMSYNPVTWQPVYSGEGLYLDLEIFCADGVLEPETYKISDNSEANSFRAGWDPGDIYGIGIDFENWGTCLHQLRPDGETVKHVTDGMVTVEKNGEIYNLKIISSVISAVYSGKLQGI